MKIQSTEKVRDLVSKYPGATPVLKHFGIDHRQQGGKSMSKACAEAKIPFSIFEKQLREGNFHSGEKVTYWRTARLTELVPHILECHHSFIKREAPKVELSLQNVIRLYGKRYPEAYEILAIFRALAEDMGQHEDREEQLLFPYIMEMEASSGSSVRFPSADFGPVDGLIFAMMQEHGAASELRQQVAELTRHYVPPPGADAELVQLYKILFDLDCDLHRHLYLENNFLYPRALKLFYQELPADVS